MRLLTCSLVLLGALAIPGWTVNPLTLRFEEAKLRATALRAKAKADVAKAKSQLSVPTPSPPKQRGKRQDFFVPDIDFQDGFQEEFEPTAQFRLSQKKVLPDNAEHNLMPHFHPELSSTDDTAQFSCLCKKLEQLNQDVDNRVEVVRQAIPQELHFPAFHNPGNLQFEVHGPGVPGVPGIVPVLDTSNFEQFQDVEFPGGRDAHEFHHHGGLPEGFGQPLLVDQGFRQAEEPITGEEFENQRNAHFHQPQHHTLSHHHQPHHKVIHSHHQAHHGFGHPIHHQQFRQADENSTNLDEASVFDEFRDIDPIEPDFNDNQDQQIRNFGDEEFRPVFNDDQNQRFEADEGFGQSLLINQDFRQAEEPITEEEEFENQRDAHFHQPQHHTLSHHHRPQHKVIHSHHQAHHGFGRPVHHQKFRQADENSTNLDEASVFDEFRDIDPIEPDFNDNQDQQIRNFGDEEFQPIFIEDQNQRFGTDEGFDLQRPLEQAQESSNRPEHSRDLQNIKGLVDSLSKFVDKSKPNITIGSDGNVKDEQFERVADDEVRFRPNEGFAQQSMLGQAPESSHRPEHSRDLQNIKGIVDSLNKFADKSKPNATMGSDGNVKDEQFERVADDKVRFRPNEGFAQQSMLGQAPESSHRPEHSRDLQNIKGIVDSLNKFADKSKPNTTMGSDGNVKDEQFERVAGDEVRFRPNEGFAQQSMLGQAPESSHRPEHSRDLQNIKGIVDSLNKFADKSKPNATMGSDGNVKDEQFERVADDKVRFRPNEGFAQQSMLGQAPESSHRPEHSRDLQNIKGIVDSLNKFADKSKPNTTMGSDGNVKDEQFERVADDEVRFRPNEGFAQQSMLGQAPESSHRPEHSRDLQNIKGIVDSLNKFADKSKPNATMGSDGNVKDEQFERVADDEVRLRPNEGFAQQSMLGQAPESSHRPEHSRDLQNIKGIVDSLNKFADKSKPNTTMGSDGNVKDEQFERVADDEVRFRPNEGFAQQSMLEQAPESSHRPEHSRDLQNIKGIVDSLNKFADKSKPNTTMGSDGNVKDEQFERVADDEVRFRLNEGFAQQSMLGQAPESSHRPEHSRDLQNIKGIVDSLKKFADKSKPNATMGSDGNVKDEQFERVADDRVRFGPNEGFAQQSTLGQVPDSSHRPEHSRDLQNIKGIVDSLNKFVDKSKPNVTIGSDGSIKDEKFERVADGGDIPREAFHNHHHHHLPHHNGAHFSHPIHQKFRQSEKNATSPHETSIFEEFRDVDPVEPDLDDNQDQHLRQLPVQVPNSQEAFDQQFVPQESQVRDAHLHHHTLIHNHGGLHHQAQVVVPGFGHGIVHQGIVPGIHQGGHQSTFQQTSFHHSGFQQPGFQQGVLQPGFQQGHQSAFQQQGLQQQGFQQQGFQQQGFQQSGLGGQGFQQQGFQQSGLGGRGFQQGLRPNPPSTLIQSQTISQRTGPQEIGPDEIRSSQDDTSAQVFDPFHEKDTTMDFLDRHQFDLPHPGFKNIEQTSRHAEAPSGHEEVPLKQAEATGGEPREARTFDPRDIFGDRVFNMLANLEHPQLRGAEEFSGEAGDAFDPSDLFADDAFANFMSDLARQNQGRGDFTETMHMNKPHESISEGTLDKHVVEDVQRHGNEENYEVASPNLFTVPRNLDWQRKKRSMLDQILERERHLVDSINNKTRNEDLNFIGQLGDRLLGDIERRRNLIQKIAAKSKDMKPGIDPRSRLDLNQIILKQRLAHGKKKRSIPLMRMISDPKVKLDLPKTMENFGTATKNVFEDEKAPMYHVKHLLGASRNAMLSAMKIPPQNIIIPSDYEIVKKDPEEVSSEEYHDERDPLGFARTFKKVGNIVRNSILSSHETANHIGEIAQDVKNVLHTVRHAAPRLILPYSQIPAIHHPPHKAMLITPRILDLTQAQESQPVEDRKLVKLGHIMDAVGISKPGESKLALDKIVFEPHYKRPPKPPSEKLVQLYSRFQDNTLDTVGDAVSALEDAKVSVGAKNLHDFLGKMRNALNHNIARAAPAHHKHKSRKQQKDDEIDKFVEALFDDSKNETVGAGLPLPRELWQPFMGRATQTELREFKAEPRRASGHRTVHHHRSSHHKPAPESVNNETVGAFIEFLKSRDEGKTKRDDHEKMKYVLGAINPMMFERMYNETLNVKNDASAPVMETKHRQEDEQRHEDDQDEAGKVGNIMALSSTVMKPFMGQNPSAVQEFLDTYNGDMGEIEPREDEDSQDPIVIDGDVMEN